MPISGNDPNLGPYQRPVLPSDTLSAILQLYYTTCKELSSLVRFKECIPLSETCVQITDPLVSLLANLANWYS